MEVQYKTIKMAKIINKTDSKRFYMVSDRRFKNIYVGHVELGKELSTGQKMLECFLTEDELKTRVNSLKGENYYETRIETDSAIFLIEYFLL